MRSESTNILTNKLRIILISGIANDQSAVNANNNSRRTAADAPMFRFFYKAYSRILLLFDIN